MLKRLALAAGALCTIAAGCAGRKPPPPPPPQVAVARPLTMSVIDWDDYDGRFVAMDSVDVRPRVSGYLLSVSFRDGDYVAKGQPLFRIDPRPYQAILDQAKGTLARDQAALANARSQIARGKVLLAGHAISQQAYDVLNTAGGQAAADLLAAQAQVRAAALNVGFTQVTAPMSGRVSDRRVAPGNLVTADTTVLTNIVNLDPIRFEFTGSEALYLKYERANVAGTRLSSRRAANPVEIRLEDEPEYRWRGRMDFVDNAIDPGSGTIRGRAVVPNPTHFLAPGMFGHLRLLGSGAYPALLIPDQATTTDQTRQIVYVIGQGGKVAQRDVVLGPLYQGLRVIRSGLAADDRVIIDGLQRAKLGIKVSVIAGRIAPTAPALAAQPRSDLGPMPSGATPPAEAGHIAAR